MNQGLDLLPTAFLIHDHLVYFTESPGHSLAELIEALWMLDPEQARSITRERIFTRVQPSPQCMGVLKVAGKRFSLLEETPFFEEFKEALSNRTPINLSKLKKNNDTHQKIESASLNQRLQWSEAMALANEVARNSSHAVGALLVDQKMNLLSWGWNDHFKNRILHAEVNVIRNHFHLHDKPIPKGSILVTTRFPCSMCAGYLHRYSEDFSSLTLVYRDEDPGPFAQNSILVPGSHLNRISGIQQLPRILRFQDQP